LFDISRQVKVIPCVTDTSYSPLKVVLFFVAIMQALNDGSIEGIPSQSKVCSCVTDRNGNPEARRVVSWTELQWIAGPARRFVRWKRGTPKKSDRLLLLSFRYRSVNGSCKSPLQSTEFGAFHQPADCKGLSYSSKQPKKPLGKLVFKILWTQTKQSPTYSSYLSSLWKPPSTFVYLLETGKHPFTQMIYVSRKEHFNAAHKLYNPAWTPEKNIAVFGPCANENWHGHNFELIVTVKGKPDPETGFVVDLKRLSTMIRKEVIDKLDHKNLNLDVDFMKDKLASCETLVIEIWKILEQNLPTVTTYGKLHSIRLYETPRNYVEYFGE
jgi:6-pyruvoyltetrahydropterin/6-carboxytetrahydropterin synthase